MSKMLMWWCDGDDDDIYVDDKYNTDTELHSTITSTKTNCQFSRDILQRFSSTGDPGRLSRRSKVSYRSRFANWTVLALEEV